MSAHPLAGTKTWCVFRNLVHAVYRETRHLEPHDDTKAFVGVRAGPFLEAAKLCRKNRFELRSRRLHSLTVQARAPAEVLQPYQKRTGLSVEDVIEVFRLPNWRPRYGGEKWAEIAATLTALVTALEDGNDVKAAQISEKVMAMHHNSGPLVTARTEWERNSWLRDKWPELCE